MFALQPTSTSNLKAPVPVTDTWPPSEIIRAVSGKLGVSNETTQPLTSSIYSLTTQQLIKRQPVTPSWRQHDKADGDGVVYKSRLQVLSTNSFLLGKTSSLFLLVCVEHI